MNFFTTAFSKLGIGHAQASSEDLREFLAQSALRAFLEKKAGPNEDFMRSEMLLIFETRIQHTWLLATNNALYCVIDARREPGPRRLWRIARSDIEQDGRLILQIGETELDSRVSYLVIDGKRPRKYTKALFTTLSIKESIVNMLSNALQLAAP